MPGPAAGDDRPVAGQVLDAVGLGQRGSRREGGGADAGDHRGAAAHDRPGHRRACDHRSATPSSTTDSSRRASAAPRQKCGPKPEGHVVVGGAADVEACPRWGRTRPRRGWPTRRAAAAGRRPRSAVPPSSVSSTAVRRNEVTGVVHRSTSSTALGSRARVGGEPVELVGVLGQRHERAGDRVAGGLVAGHEELDEEHAELVVGERLAVLLVGGQHRHHVVAGLGPPSGRQAEQLHRHLGEQLHALVLGPVGGAGDGGLGPPEQPLLVALGQAEERGDELDGQRHGELGGDVDDLAVAAAAAASSSSEPAGALAHQRLEPAHHRVGEAGPDQLAVAGVLRRVGVHHRGRRCRR